MPDVLSIVINSNIVRIAHLHKGRGGTRVKRLLEKECPKSMVDDSTVTQPEAFAGFLKLQLSGANIHVRDCIFTLPADKLMTREVVLPDLADARIRQIVETNAAEYFPINLSDYVLGFYRIAAVRKAHDASDEEGGREGEDVKSLRRAEPFENLGCAGRSPAGGAKRSFKEKRRSAARESKG